MAWIPCNVPARMRMVLSGSGGRVSTLDTSSNQSSLWWKDIEAKYERLREREGKLRRKGVDPRRLPLYDLLKTRPPALLMTHRA